LPEEEAASSSGSPRRKSTARLDLHGTPATVSRVLTGLAKVGEATNAAENTAILLKLLTFWEVHHTASGAGKFTFLSGGGGGGDGDGDWLVLLLFVHALRLLKLRIWFVMGSIHFCHVRFESVGAPVSGASFESVA